MTQERKCFVSPTDVSAVRLRCKNCGAASVIPVEMLPNLSALENELEQKCPYCRAESGFSFETQELRTACAFIRALGSLRALLDGRNLEISLQVECSE